MIGFGHQIFYDWRTTYMNKFELEIQMGTHPAETPVDNLIQALTAAGTQNPWTYCSDCGAGHPGFPGR